MGLEDILKKMLKASFGKPGNKRRTRWEDRVAQLILERIEDMLKTRPAPPPPRNLPPPLPPPVVADSRKKGRPASLNPDCSYCTPASDTRSFLLVRAMIAAANADHQIDEQERARVLSSAEFYGLNDSDRRLLHAEFDHPASIATIARDVADDATLGRQVYLVSLLALELDNEPERLYLSRLASALGIPPSEVRELHEQAEL